MSSLISSRTNFEELPDEILLFICGYLSSTDILFSFHGLNRRLSQTISGYCRHVVLGRVPYKRFNHICQSILPDISVHICSLVISNDWKGILSKEFLNYFGKQMSKVFPCLKRLIFTTFLIDSLMSFLGCLQNLSQLFELKIISLYEMGISSTLREVLLQKIFTANEHRLTSISLDDDSLTLPYKNETDISYPHIEKLVIELENLNDLHRLLTDLPRLQFIDVAVNEEILEFNEETQYTPLLTLRYFRLRSFVHSWTLKELLTIFKRIPNVEELIIQIITRYDARLIDGEQMFSHLSMLPLKKFTYFLQFKGVAFSDHSKIISSWQQFSQEFICTKSDDDRSVVLYSLPFHCPYLILRHTLAKNKAFSDDFTRQVRCLTLYEVPTRIAEMFSIITKCHRIQCLNLQVDEITVSKPFQETPLRKLSSLTFFVALQPIPVNTDDFRKLLEASPNLYHLAIDYEVMTPLFDNDCLCELLGCRITDLLISINSKMSSELMVTFISRLASVCPALKHFYFHIKDDHEPIESLILTVLNHLPRWNRLVSFGVANIKMDSNILAKGVREWVIANSSLKDNRAFLIDYSTSTFRLWF